MKLTNKRIISIKFKGEKKIINKSRFLKTLLIFSVLYNFSNIFLGYA
jgi:ATP/ADP translocase